jgi:hypothetical protein
MTGSMAPSMVGSLLRSMPATFVEGMGAAWATVLPTVQPRWIAAVAAALVGTVVGLALLQVF